MKKSQKYIYIEDTEIEVPDNIIDLEIYREWYIKRDEYDNDNSRNIIICNKSIKLPHPNLDYVLKNTPDITPADVKRIKTLNTKFNKIQGGLSALLRKARGYGSEEAKKRELPTTTIIDDNTSSIILDLLGKWHTPLDVHKILPSMGISGVSYERILNFSHKNSVKIKEMRDSIRTDYDDISVGVKRSRIEKLNYLLNNTLQEYEEMNGPKRLDYSKEIRAILDQARKEVEGEELKLTVEGRLDVEAIMIQASNQSSLLQELTITQLILSRVASRMGLSSQFLIDKLAYGFYAKYNGFRKTEDLQTKPIYPSSISYDILELEGRHKEWKESQKKYFEEAQVIEESSEKVDREVVKKALRENLKKLI